MEEALITKLLGTTAITNLVSTRVFVGARPQASTLPAIVINRISGAPLYSDDGEDGLEESRFQIDCWGLTYSSAKAVARAVRTALSAFQGTVSGVNFRYVSLDLEHDIQETGSNTTDYPFRTSLDFIFMFDN